MSSSLAVDADAPPSGEAPALKTRNDYVKALHSALLMRFGVEGTRAFWSAHPLDRAGRRLNERELADYVWAEGAKSPLAWNIALVNGLEAFLLERGATLAEFGEQVRRFANRGSFVQPRHLLTWLGPILLPMFRFGDPYRLLLLGARLVANRLAPDLDFRLPPWRGASTTDKDHRAGSVWVLHPRVVDASIPPWDFSVQPGQEVVAAPHIFGLPPYESIAMIADVREPEGVLWGARCDVAGDRFLIEGVDHGRLTGWQEFLASAGYDPGDLAGSTGPVVAIERDYRCPRRGRTVLFAGCAYGAPGYLARFSWKRERLALRNFLGALHAEVGDDGDPVEREIEALHQQYVDRVSEQLHVTFFAADGSIAVGGKHVCRGVPARLLFECVRLAIEKDRSEFTYRELKRLPSLVSHPKNTGFETRLRRLRAALDEANVGIAIEPRGRGRFALVTSGRLELDPVSQRLP